MPYILVHLPWLRVNGLALFPFIFVQQPNPSKQLLNHEKIHLRQQIELLLIPFYLWYILEYWLNLFKYPTRFEAYYFISFEQEAYKNDHDLSYLKQRKLWAFLGYFPEKAKKQRKG